MPSLMQKLAFAAGAFALALVLLPPLSGIAEHLFAAHMMQHLLIIAAAAPLLALSGVFAGFECTRLGQALAHPVTAWLAFVGVFLFWHWPAAFQWAAGNEASRLLEHISILITAILFWNVALSPRQDLSRGAQALFVMTAAVATDLPGAIMVFAPRALCTMPAENAAPWGLTPLQDQQIAGMLMWVPANLVFFGIATWLFGLWMTDTAQQTQSSSSEHLVIP
jgi:cytochrome c oxidase assembly factor CtaG